ncbi:hypothetical protein [Streptomyces sp. CBMA156]|uniref:hypothetical protein n=1 Tax=Streptomyces sp. CBMA156 TaxID=1930280 RepID=UPI0016619D85|nr:hypothetical protein [Streptomyces sp. CBMA156]MBD0670326.1 hypothetical protein [Streptomyces sp. CBMA156]
MGGNGSVRASARVVWRRKELVLLPATATVVVGGLLALLVWAQVRVGGSVVLGVVGVLPVAVVATFLNAVTVLAADDALRGRPVAVGACWARAAARWRVIVAWAAFGLLGLLGSLLLVGTGWSMANYLALPGLVLDGAGVREARRSSREAYRRDRGRFMRGSVRRTIPVQLATFPCLVVFVAGLVATDRGLGARLMAGSALCLGAAVTVTASLYGVFRAALYRESAGAEVERAPAPASASASALHVSAVE